LTKQQFDDRYKNKKPVYVYRRTKDDYIDAVDKNKSNMARYANTSGDKSNAKFVNDNVRKKVNVVAKTHINEDDEIFISYGSSYKII
jgi:SET domain-containing protein